MKLYLIFALLVVPICSSLDERIAVVNILTENLTVAFRSLSGKLQVAYSTDTWKQWSVGQPVQHHYYSILGVLSILQQRILL